MRTSHFCRPSVCVLLWPLHLSLRVPLPLHIAVLGLWFLPLRLSGSVFPRNLRAPQNPSNTFLILLEFGQSQFMALEAKETLMDRATFQPERAVGWLLSVCPSISVHPRPHLLLLSWCPWRLNKSAESLVSGL